MLLFHKFLQTNSHLLPLICGMWHMAHVNETSFAYPEHLVHEGVAVAFPPTTGTSADCLVKTLLDVCVDGQKATGATPRNHQSIMEWQ